MPSQRTFILASIAFGVLWTAAMIWMSSPMPVVGMIIFAPCGAIAGLVWYFAMRIVMARLMRARS